MHQTIDMVGDRPPVSASAQPSGDARPDAGPGVDAVPGPAAAGPDAPTGGGEDTFRNRLGRLGRWLPATNRPLAPRSVWRVARRLSVTRSLYWSLRFKGRCLVARRTKIVTQRTSRVVFGPRGWLLLGLLNNGPNRALLDLGRNATLIVNGTVQAWRGAQLMVFAGGTLEIGDKCIFNEDSKVICFKSIRFGDSSGLSWNALAMDSDLHPISIGGSWKEKDAPVVFGDRAFVGAGGMVLKGVHVGAGTIVAAGSVVTKDLPARCLAAGNPARVLCEDIDWI